MGKAKLYKGIWEGEYDTPRMERAIQRTMKPDKFNPQGMTREQATRFVNLYKDQYRKYRWEER